MRRECDANSEGSIQHVVEHICIALHDVEVAKMDLAMDVGSEVAHLAAYCAQFAS